MNLQVIWNWNACSYVYWLTRGQFMRMAWSKCSIYSKMEACHWWINGCQSWVMYWAMHCWQLWVAGEATSQTVTLSWLLAAVQHLSSCLIANIRSDEIMLNCLSQLFHWHFKQSQFAVYCVAYPNQVIKSKKSDKNIRWTKTIWLVNYYACSLMVKCII